MIVNKSGRWKIGKLTLKIVDCRRTNLLALFSCDLFTLLSCYWITLLSRNLVTILTKNIFFSKIHLCTVGHLGRLLHTIKLKIQFCWWQTGSLASDREFHYGEKTTFYSTAESIVWTVLCFYLLKVVPSP